MASLNFYHGIFMCEEDGESRQAGRIDEVQSTMDELGGLTKYKVRWTKFFKYGVHSSRIWATVFTDGSVLGNPLPASAAGLARSPVGAAYGSPVVKPRRGEPREK